jgi:cytochrome c
LARGRARTIASVFATALSLSVLALPAAAEDASAENGADVFKKCRACHQIGPQAHSLVGPELNGIIGRKAAAVQGFPYSDAAKKAGAGGLVWTEEALFKYLENPQSVMKGTKMSFAGLKDPQDRKDVIAYLKKFSTK